MGWGGGGGGGGGGGNLIRACFVTLDGGFMDSKGLCSGGSSRRRSCCSYI